MKRGCYISFLLFVTFVYPAKYVALKRACRLYRRWLSPIVCHLTLGSGSAELQFVCGYQPELGGDGVCSQEPALRLGADTEMAGVRGL